MRARLLGALALLAATFVTPVHAAPRNVVYEVVRGPHAGPRTEVTITLRGTERLVTMSALLEPHLGGYRHRSVSLRRFSSARAERTTVELGRGERFLVAGERGRLAVRAEAAGWSVRDIGGGFQTVWKAPGDSTSEPYGVDVYRHASAPAGPYGSVAFAEVPCEFGAGTWTMTPEGEQPRSFTCATMFTTGRSHFGETARARRWTVDGEVREVRGVRGGPVLRLAVLDYPKR